MTPCATVTVTGCVGGIPVVPNPGDAVTTATGRGAGAALVGAPLLELPSDVGPTGESSPESGGPASPPLAGGGEVAVDDSEPVPQPAVTTTIAVTTSARHRNRR